MNKVFPLYPELRSLASIPHNGVPLRIGTANDPGVTDPDDGVGDRREAEHSLAEDLA